MQESRAKITDNLSMGRAAKRLGVSVFTLRRWALFERSVAYHRLGRQVFFKESDLLAFERRRRFKAKPEPRRKTAAGGA